jgi:AcrR family transcriptional regulator
MALAGLQTIASSDRPAAERLRLAVRHHIVTLVEDLDNVACFVEEGRALAPPHLEAHIATRDAYERCFRQIIEDGVRRGEFAPVDVRLAGFAILGMCNWTVRWFRPDGPWTPEEISRHFGDLAAAALGAAYPAAAGLGLAVEARSSLPRGEHGPAARQFTTPARGE